MIKNFQIYFLHSTKIFSKIKISLILFLVSLISPGIKSQIYTQDDVRIFNQIMSFADEKELCKKPINEVIIEIGKSFLNTKYVPHTLESDGEEQLVINLNGFDCTTYLETSLAFARCVKKGKTSFQDYQNELNLIRYRDGKLEHYPSRLHYFSDWIYNNQQKGIVKDITKEIGGKPITFKLNFMSENPKYYKQLKENPDFISLIRKQEQEINTRQYYYIPEKDIEKIEDKIKEGDLIAISTNDKGLDIGHTGIAVKSGKGRIHFLHASTNGYKVQITDSPLSEYVRKNKKHSGIIVLRLIEP